MKCSQIKKKLSAYFDDEIEDNEREIIASHLENCAVCQEEMAALVKVKKTLSVLPGMEVPLYFMTRLKQRIKDEETLAEKPMSILEKIKRVAVYGAAFTGVVVSLFAGNQMGRTLYQQIMTDTQPVSFESDNILGFGSFEEFPAGSLSDVYGDLIIGGNNG
jgi:anti-sigma factor RsiW